MVGGKTSKSTSPIPYTYVSQQNMKYYNCDNNFALKCLKTYSFLWMILFWMDKSAKDIFNIWFLEQ